ncbi:SRPBCC family protein [Pseudonocardiaceae bacterium YIM PH 21723]|nr:SRPBCC family protein [Pseudonocardiaceae bacterium YIM PH 21723]
MHAWAAFYQQFPPRVIVATRESRRTIGVSHGAERWRIVARDIDGLHQVTVTLRCSANAEDVYALLADGASWPSWASVTSATVEPAVIGSPHEIRVFRTRLLGWPLTLRQQLIGCVPGRVFYYSLASGLPIRNHRGSVDLQPRKNGCAITWTAGFRPEFPGTGWLLCLVLKGFLQRCLYGLVRQATPQPIEPEPVEDWILPIQQEYVDQPARVADRSVL